MTSDDTKTSTANPSFLLAKASGTARQNRVPETDPNVDALALAEFPEVPTGSTFTFQALSKTEGYRTCGALVIQIDTPIPDDLSKEALTIEAARNRVARVIDTVSLNEKGFWGVLDRLTFGGLFPGKDGPSCLEIAEKIKGGLLKTSAATLTIGIAVFPTLDYHVDHLFENAYKALAHARFFGPNSLVTFDALSLNVSGDARYDAGDIQGAIEEFKKGIMLNSADANLHNSLGVCYGQMGDFESALCEFETALQLSPDEPLALFNAGLSSLLMGNKQRALAYLLDAEKADPPFFEAVLQIGKIHLDMQEPLTARPYLEKAVEIRGESGPATTCLGECYAALGMTDEAQSAYKKALRLNANDAASLSGLGWIYANQGKDPEIGKLFCQHSVEIAPGNGLFRHRLGEIYVKENRLQSALDEFNKAIALGYNSLEAVENVKNLLTDAASKTG